VRLTGDLTSVTVNGNSIDAAGKLNITNGTAVNLSINGGRPTTDTRATAALFFGDSVVQGYSASTVANTWWRIVADAYGWTYTNCAFSGAVVTDLNWQSQPGYSYTNEIDSVRYVTPTATATNLTIFAKVGINDGASFPSTSGDFAAYLTHYYQSWLYFAAYWATPGKTLATAATASGTWTAWTNYFAASVGRQSTTSGDTLTFTTQGDAIYVAFPVSLTNTTSFGKFWVSIDGTAIELVDPNGTGFGNRNQWTTPESYIPFSATNAFWAKRYAGYGSRRHTVTITATNNASLATVINWVAGSQQPIGPNSGPSVFLLENLNRAADATRDATFAALRAKPKQVADHLAGDGLQVAWVPLSGYYNPSNSGDGIHPNDAGMIEMATGVKRTVDRFRGLALSAGQGSSGSGLSAAGSGLTDTGGTVSLGGTLTSDANLTGGANGVTLTRTSAGNAALKTVVGASTYGHWIQADSSFPLLIDSSGTPNLYFRAVGGTIASPTAVSSGANLGRLNISPYAGSSTYQTSAYLQALATENHSVGAAGSKWEFYAATNGASAGTLRMTIAPGTVTLADSLAVAGAATVTGNISGAAISGSTVAASGNATVGGTLTVTGAVTGTTAALNTTSVTPFVITRYTTGTGGANIHLRHARGTEGSPTALSSGDSIGTINFTPYGSSFANSAQIITTTTEALSGSALGTSMSFYTTPTGTATPGLALVLNASGSASFASSVSATALTASGLTSGRIPLVSTSGLLIDNSAFTYTSNTHLNVPTLYASSAIELGNASDTTLARVSAGVVSIEGVKIATQPTTETLTYSGGTNVTITAGKGPMQRSLLTVTNNFQLLWSGLTDNDGGVVHLIPATTNVTVLVSSPGRAAGSTAATATGSTTLTITGATNGWAELAWSVVSVGGTNRVSVNLGAY
jgi:hypothetical protein